MARTPIDFGTGGATPDGELVFTAFGKVNQHALLDDQLQALVGHPQGDAQVILGTQSGTVPPDLNWESGDTVYSLLDKHERRIGTEGSLITQNDANRTSRVLGVTGQEYSLLDAVAGTWGTTYITVGGGVASQYPLPNSNLQYEIQVTRSANLTGPGIAEGFLLTYTLRATSLGTTYVWAASKAGSDPISSWEELAPRFGLTQNNRIKQSFYFNALQTRPMPTGCGTSTTPRR